LKAFQNFQLISEIGLYYQPKDVDCSLFAPGNLVTGVCGANGVELYHFLVDEGAEKFRLSLKSEVGFAFLFLLFCYDAEIHLKDPTLLHEAWNITKIKFSKRFLVVVTNENTAI
jgi:hypothetical protein